MKEEIIAYYEDTVVLGDPRDKDTMVGPMVSKEQQETVLEYIETGKTRRC